MPRAGGGFSRGGGYSGGVNVRGLFGRGTSAAKTSSSKPSASEVMPQGMRPPFMNSVKRTTADPNKAAKNAARKQELLAQVAARRQREQLKYKQHMDILDGKRPRGL